MTRSEVLELAIRTAINNGWLGYEYYISPCKTGRSTDIMVEPVTGGAYEYVISVVNKYSARRMSPDVMSIIFTHEFAKALWGEYTEAVWGTHLSKELLPDTPKLPELKDSDMLEEYWSKYAVCQKCGKSLRSYDSRKSNCGDPIVKGNVGWKLHLQAMVLWEDPIKYLEAYSPIDKTEDK